MDTLTRVRRWILALLTVGVVGTEIELLLIDHYEEAWQIAPLAVLALALVVIVWHAVLGGAASVRALQAVMVAFIAAGTIGLVLHYRGNLEFQLEMDASQAGWALFRKVMQAKAPPALAPVLMAQLGFLGLVYTYRHPATHPGEQT